MQSEVHAGDAILGFCFAWVFKALYISGLTLLIPALLVLVLPEELAPIALASSPVLFAAAAFLIVISVFGLHAHYRTMRSTLLHLGLSTLIPGGLAIAFTLVQREFVFGLAESYIPGFVAIKPLVIEYVDRSVPKIIALAVAFALLGVVLMWLSRWLSRPLPRLR